jgi:hypothetical protein
MEHRSTQMGRDKKKVSGIRFQNKSEEKTGYQDI